MCDTNILFCIKLCVYRIHMRSSNILMQLKADIMVQVNKQWLNKAASTQ